MDRRHFIHNSLLASTGLLLPQSYMQASERDQYQKLVILHTNDTHSRIDPFEQGEYQGLGGVSARHALIQQIRREEKHVLLVDAGDIFQGTPYFNMYHGELEMKAMAMMGYDCGTFGNHDFDMGTDNLATQSQHANFPFVVSNYYANDTALHNVIKPYTIIQKGSLRIGILGLGLDLEGFVPRENFQNLVISNPTIEAEKIAKILRYDEKCHLVIALSHLGYTYPGKKTFSDTQIAQEVDNLDIIIGGHTHTFLSCPKMVQKGDKKFVLINQVGFGGINLGRLDVYFDHRSEKVANIESILLKCHQNTE